LQRSDTLEMGQAKLTVEDREEGEDTHDVADAHDVANGEGVPGGSDEERRE
jgi:hypothetical protein